MTMPDSLPPALHFRVTCPQSGVTAESDDGASLDSLISCPPESGCCQVPHDHAAAANACPGGHGACPAGADCTVITAAGEACPGGHCHADLDDCTVCHPLVIDAKIAMLAQSG
jgi:hypothetical protein